ncbi:MAG TPA: phosphotransferase [Acidimicrobiia bacterium]
MEPGRLIAAGRAAQIFEYGNDRVLRRSMTGFSFAYEANVMELARGFGVPVPAVHELRADDTEIVMDRIAGPTMVDWILHGPWRIRSAGRILAEFHDAVHKVIAPTWLHDAGDGGRSLLHLDLHPLNIIMGPNGPVLIDWTNSARGKPGTDIAFTWMLLSTGEPPSSPLMTKIIGAFRKALVQSFVSRTDRAAAVAAFPYAAELHGCDPNLTDTERVAVARLVRSVTGNTTEGAHD